MNGYLISQEVQVSCFHCGQNWKTKILLSINPNKSIHMSYPEEMGNVILTPNEEKRKKISHQFKRNESDEWIIECFNEKDEFR